LLLKIKELRAMMAFGLREGGRDVPQMGAQ
jgi:hypothetical protein